MNSIFRWYWIGKAFGWENVPWRIWFLAKRRLGVERRALRSGEASAKVLRRAFVADYRPSDASDYWRKRSQRLFNDVAGPANLRPMLASVATDDAWRSSVSEQVRRLAQGELKYFGHRYYQVGWPVRFDYDPIHDVNWPSGNAATEINSFDPGCKDIKCVWESSRFSIAYALAREHVRHPGSPAADLFWEHLDSWDSQNPYGLSVNWVCGQEASVRFIAWLFAACATLDCPAATTERLHRLTQLIWYTGRQISFNITYARSQKNNHAFSEAAALWTIGHFFGEFPSAAQWRAQGRKILVAEAHRQIYKDGSYIQHSPSYHRVMLDNCLWAMRIGELCDDPLDTISKPVSNAVNWLLEMIDPNTGRVPNYGPNDGAQVLPLSCCDCLDYRPVAQAGHYLLHRKRCFESGPWDEHAMWLCGPDALQATVSSFPKSSHFAAPVGGYYTLAGPQTWGMIRAVKYCDRPHQADMLHFDLWSLGTNILRDGGSFLYNGDPPWKDWFPSTAAHNTVEVDSVDQMVRGPRFLWLLWAECKVLAKSTSSAENASFFEAEHYGYRRLASPVTHRRRIDREGDRYRICDTLLGSGRHQVALRWRLCDGAWAQKEATLTLTTGNRRYIVTIGQLPRGISMRVARGEESFRPEGWESMYYAERSPSPTILVVGTAELPLTLETMIEVQSTT